MLAFSKVRKRINGVKFNDILDVWVFKYNGIVDLNNALTHEVEQTKWLCRNEVLDLLANREMVDSLNYFKSKYELARADAENERTLLVARRSRLKEEQNGYINNEKVYAEYEQQIADLDEEIDDAGDKIAIFDAQLSNVGKRSNADVWGDISGRLDGISKTYSAISSARNEMIESGRLSLDTVESILY